MPAVKKVSDHYYVTSPEVTITGNLTVIGNSASITTTEAELADRIITLNNGETANGVTGQEKVGLQVDRGSAPDAFFVFDEADDTWKVSNDAGATYQNVITTSSQGLQDVVDDTTPELGGDLEIAGFVIERSSVGVSLALNTEAGGGSGVFVTNSLGANQELVTKRKAIVYALILG